MNKYNDIRFMVLRAFLVGLLVGFGGGVTLTVVYPVSYPYVDIDPDPPPVVH